MKVSHKILHATVVVCLSCLSGCNNTEASLINDDPVVVEDPVTVEESSSELNVEFSVSPHDSNVLMVNTSIMTDEAVDVSIEIQSAQTQSHTISSSSAATEHNITVPGLRPDTTYLFTATVTNGSGEVTSSRPQSYTTPSLPFDLPDIQLTTSSDSSYPGLTFFALAGPDARFVAVDEAGIPVWYLADDNIPMLSNSPVVKYLGENLLMLMLNSEVWVIDMMGKVKSTYELPTFHHEATILDNGNIMVLTNERKEFNGSVLKGDLIQEYNPAGTLVWQWSSFDHLDTSRFPGNLSTRVLEDGTLDWTHANAIFQQQDGSILLSLRSQSWVVNIDHASGDINWILGSPDGTVNASLLDKFVTLESGSWMSAQHAPMQTADGDYLIYDNRNESLLSGSSNNSRAVKYQVDTNAMKATEVWEHVVDKYTKSLGDVDELPNGNILITAGGPGSDDNAHLIEVTASDPAQVVWELLINNESIYCAERVGWDALLSVNGQDAEALTLSGKISGLHGDGLELVNGSETLSISAGATTFAFAQTIAQGSAYNVQLIATPHNHTCSVSNGVGVMSGDTEELTVSCVDQKVNADLTHLPIGDPLILQRINGDTAHKSVNYGFVVSRKTVLVQLLLMTGPMRMVHGTT